MNNVQYSRGLDSHSKNSNKKKPIVNYTKYWSSAIMIRNYDSADPHAGYDSFSVKASIYFWLRFIFKVYVPSVEMLRK